MVTSPEALASSRRIGAVTVRVRSKLPPATGPIVHPVAATAMVVSKRANSILGFWCIDQLSGQCQLASTLAQARAPVLPGRSQYGTQNGEIMFRERVSLKRVPSV